MNKSRSTADASMSRWHFKFNMRRNTPVQENDFETLFDKDYSSEMDFNGDLDIESGSDYQYLFGSNPIIQRYCVDSDNDTIFRNSKLFSNSKHCVADVMMSVNMLRTTCQFGDTEQGLILGNFIIIYNPNNILNLIFLKGTIASFLPNGNPLVSAINENKINTQYRMNQLIKKGASRTKQMPHYKVQVCRGGCITYCGNNSTADACVVCNLRRSSLPMRYMFYLPIRDRIIQLLLSDIGKFMSYPTLRRRPQPGYMDDVYDGTCYKHFQSIMENGVELIAIQVCWDGADLFNHSGKSVWPITWSIMNFPPELRDKLHVGLHCASFDDGSEASVSLFCDELLHLWNNNIIVKGKEYKVCLISAVFDGPAYQKFTKTQGSQALAGCNKCYFPGMSFGGAVRFIGYQRFVLCLST
jgi:hypothetical protein